MRRTCPAPRRTRIAPRGSLTVWALFGLAVPATAQDPLIGDLASRDRTDIHALWETVDDAWNSRDAERFSDLFTESASLWFVDRGERIETRARILDRFIGQFDGQSPDLRHTTRIDTVHALTGGLTGIDGEVLIERLATDGTPVRRFAVTGVLEHEAAGWRIRVLRAFQIWPRTHG